MPVDALVNGRFSTSIEINDRGLAYGDGLFETIKIQQGSPQYLALHLQRLQHGCSRLGIDCDLPAIQQDIETLLPCAANKAAVLKLMVTRESLGRGYKPDPKAGSNRMLTIELLTNDYAVEQERGVAVRLCDTRLGINPQLAGIKHLSRLENVLARNEWSDKTITEGLMLDTDGRLVEGTMSNLFIVKDKTLQTPGLHRCGVSGVMRQLVIDRLAVSEKHHSLIVDLSVDDMYSADEVFICNSLMGIVPVVAVGVHRKPIGDVTRSLQQALLHVSQAND